MVHPKSTCGHVFHTILEFLAVEKQAETKILIFFLSEDSQVA